MLRTFGSSWHRRQRTSYAVSTSRRTATPSISEKPAPMQRRTPPPKGIQVFGRRALPSRNRSGRKARGRGGWSSRSWASRIDGPTWRRREVDAADRRRLHQVCGPPSGSPGAAASTPSAPPRGRRRRPRGGASRALRSCAGSLPSSCRVQARAVAVVSWPASRRVTSWSRSSSSVRPVAVLVVAARSSRESTSVRVARSAALRRSRDLGVDQRVERRAGSRRSRFHGPNRCSRG